MSKRGNVIDPEMAEAIKNLLLPPIDWDVRPVLWPNSKVDEIVESIREDAAMIIEKECQRNLAHFICLEDIVRLLIVRSRHHSDGLQVLAVDDLFVPYDFADGGPIHVVTRFLMGNDQGLKSCLMVTRDNAQIIKTGKIAMFKTEELQTRSQEDQSAVAMARVLEYYAFSPYTTYKQRPTVNQAMNASRGRSSRDSWPAIEVVHLRIPKRPEHYEPTGRHINIRYTVTEHLRRQPTKKGIKLITIKEHKRGPVDAPEKPKRTKVYKVVN